MKDLKGKSVAIVAMGRSCMAYVHQVSFFGSRRLVADETWVINAMGSSLQHDLLFQMDDLRIQELRAKEKPESSVAGMLGWLKKHPNFLTSRQHPDYPGGREYPLEKVVNCLGFCYFNSTVAYAIAYAIYNKVKEIQIYGCDFTYPQAHKAERGRACTESLIMVARERGIEVKLPHGTTLMDADVPPTEKPYGYDTEFVTVKRVEDRFIVERQERESIPTAKEIENRYNYEAFAKVN